jgi:phosphatidylserine decarboxylase
LEIVAEKSEAKIGITQISGVLARCIVNVKKEGELVSPGEFLGLIRFGSRVDVEVPEGYKPVVKPGTRVHGLSSVVAKRVS